jgi:hypothetical protein
LPQVPVETLRHLVLLRLDRLLLTDLAIHVYVSGVNALGVPSWKPPKAIVTTQFSPISALVRVNGILPPYCCVIQRYTAVTPKSVLPPPLLLNT